MLFSSLTFIFIFMPVSILLYYLAPQDKRNNILLLASLVFYTMGEPIYVIVLLLSLFLNYWLNRWMCESSVPSKKILMVILAGNLANLFCFKYMNFFVYNMDLILGTSFSEQIKINLPLGISFYTFQMISYQMDCYHRKIEKPAGIWQFFTYVCMFPQLVAGPIVQYDEVSEQLETQKRPVLMQLEYGLQIFTVGLGLKVILANQIGTLWNTIQGIGVQYLDWGMAWLGAIAFSMQIYFDFWGYSLMAIGLGMMLGFQLPQNFKNPYCSKSVTEFWRRWHITLGRWFRNYLYIPLGGNRLSMGRTCVNLFVVWACTGMWHGASWNFMLWGLVFGVLIGIEKLWLYPILDRSKVIGHLYVLFLLPITWMLFAITDCRQAIMYIGSMFGLHSANVMTGFSQIERYLFQYRYLLVLCVFCITPIPMNLFKRYHRKMICSCLLLVVFWVSIYLLYEGHNNPFLYFRF